jgi:hypothetical protein
MRHLPHSTDEQDLIAASLAAGDGEETTAVGRRRFDRGVGAWLGGIVLGTGGCLFGASMPYQHPVGVVVSVLWWGLYLGCLGMSLGAVLGLWAEPGLVDPSQEADGAGEPQTEVNGLTALADSYGFVDDASQATGGDSGLPALGRRVRVPGR